MSWEDNINTIVEIYPGQYQIILDFATSAFVKYAIKENYKFVWVCNHSLRSDCNWEKRNVPLFDKQVNFDVLSRNLRFDFIMPTNEFIQVLPYIESGITLLQINQLPKYYLDVSRIKGRTLYELLTKECDYLFELDIPSASDYGTIVSGDRAYLQSLLDNSEIDGVIFLNYYSVQGGCGKKCGIHGTFPRSCGSPEPQRKACKSRLAKAVITATY